MGLHYSIIYPKSKEETIEEQWHITEHDLNDVLCDFGRVSFGGSRNHVVLMSSADVGQMDWVYRHPESDISDEDEAARWEYVRARMPKDTQNE